jgi:NADPH-dependent curcumin reductase CurA
MQGFIIGDFSADFPEAKKQLNEWVKDGKLKFTETIENGFTNLPKALIGLFTGENTGKMIVKV